MQRVDSDEVRIKKDFASINIKECARVSLFSVLASLWQAAPENELLEIFQFAYSSNNKIFAVYANGSIYLITGEGKMNTTQVGKSILSIEFHPKTSNLAILTNKEVSYYDCNLNFVQSVPNKNQGIKLIKNESSLYILSKTSIVSVSENGKVIPVEPWKFAFGTEKYIAIVGKNTIIMNNDESVININYKFNNPIDASLSHDGVYFYILESNNQLLIFENYALRNTIQMVSTSQICGWTGQIFVSMSPVGTLSFIDFNGRQIKSKNISKGSVIFPIFNGFIVIKPTDVTNDKTHFDLIRFSAVTPYEIYIRNCERGYFTDALALIKQFNFDTDIYHKAFVEHYEPSKRIINEHLKEINDKDFVYDYILRKNPMSADIMGLLIREGLRIRPNDERLMKMQERLHIFVKTFKGSFPERQWAIFKECSLGTELGNWIRSGRFEDVATVLTLTTELSEEERNNILNAVSPFTDPEEYQSLMPNDPSYFEKRAMEIDRRTGDTEIIVRLLKIGKTRNSKLQSLYNDAQELDNFVCSTSNDSAAAEMTLEKFSVLPDDEKLFLYVGNCSNGDEAAKIMKGAASGICKRSQQAIIDLSTRVLTNGDPAMFKRMQKTARVSEVSKMLQALSENRETAALQVLRKMDLTLDMKTIQVLADSWKPLVSDSILRMMALAVFYVHCIGETTFSNIIENISTKMICDVGRGLIESKTFSLTEWETFAKLSRKLQNSIIKDKEFEKSFREVSFVAMITLREWAEIEVKTKAEIDVLIQHVEKFIRSAKTCKAKDQDLTAAVTCLGMIPDGSSLPQVKKLFKRIQVYYAFDEFDAIVSPSIIDTAEDITALVITLLEQQTATDVKVMEKQVKSLAKQIDGIDLGRVYSFLARRALESNSISFGIGLLEYADENVILSYIDSPNWNDSGKKVSLCENLQMKCSPENLSSFVDREFSLLGTPNLSSMEEDERDMEILRFALQCMDKEITKMSIPMLKKPVEETIKRFGKEIISKDLDSYVKLIEHLHSIPAITDSCYKNLIENYSQVVLSLDSIEEQYEALKQLVIAGIHIDLPDLYAKSFVRCQLKKELDLETAEEISEKWNDEGLPPKDALGLAVGLQRLGCLSEVVSINLAVADNNGAPQKFIEDRGKWASVLSGSAELAVLKKTGNVTFGLNSKHQDVVDTAHALMSTDTPLPGKAIDAIIERGDAATLVGTGRFAQVMERARSKPLLRKVFDSLRSAGHDDFLAKVLCDYYSMPDVFAEDPKAVLQMMDRVLG